MNAQGPNGAGPNGAGPDATDQNAADQNAADQNAAGPEPTGASAPGENAGTAGATSGSGGASPGGIGLTAELVVRRGAFVLEAKIEVAPGEVLAVLGPNGSGKSTLLATLAGLIRPVSARMLLNSRELTRLAPSAGNAIDVPPDRRRVGLLGQDPLLFPHLSALENVAFGPIAQGERKADALRDALERLTEVGLGGLENRKPAALSGGQRQRVAIARALAARPDLLLLDEPMAALDVETATVIRQVLADRIAAAGIPAVLVTHDPLDAFVLADRVAILDNGRIVESGAKERVLGEPQHRFAASLAGAGLISAIADADGSVRLDLGARPGTRVWLRGPLGG